MSVPLPLGSSGSSRRRSTTGVAPRGAASARRIAAALLVVLSASCATMVRGTTDEVRLAAVPADGSVVLADGVEHRLGRDRVLPRTTRSVTFRHPRYGERTIRLDRRFSVDFLLLDLLLTAGAGVAVDAWNHAWFDLPDEVVLDFPTGRVLQRTRNRVVQSRVGR